MIIYYWQLTNQTNTDTENFYLVFVEDYDNVMCCIFTLATLIIMVKIGFEISREGTSKQLKKKVCLSYFLTFVSFIPWAIYTSIVDFPHFITRFWENAKINNFFNYTYYYDETFILMLVAYVMNFSLFFIRLWEPYIWKNIKRLCKKKCFKEQIRNDSFI